MSRLIDGGIPPYAHTPGSHVRIIVCRVYMMHNRNRLQYVTQPTQKSLKFCSLCLQISKWGIQFDPENLFAFHMNFSRITPIQYPILETLTTFHIVFMSNLCDVLFGHYNKQDWKMFSLWPREKSFKDQAVNYKNLPFNSKIR